MSIEPPFSHSLFLKFSAESDEKKITMKVAAPPNILIKQLLRKKIGSDSYRFYETVESNGTYPSLVGPERHAAQSCRHERIGRHEEFEVALHSDLTLSDQLFHTVFVLQTEFFPRPSLPPNFYIRNDVVIEPFTGRLLLLTVEDFRADEAYVFEHDRSVWDLHYYGFFQGFMPHLPEMLEHFKAMAARSVGHSVIWGLGIPASASPSWSTADEESSVRPIVDFPFRESESVLSGPEAVIARLRKIGDKKMTRTLALKIFGVSGSGEQKLREANDLRCQVAFLIHPDRNKAEDAELLKRLNDAFDRLKGRRPGR